MMNKCITLVGSNHSQSINKQFTKAVIKNYSEIEFIDIEGLEVPVFDQDLEKSEGYPIQIKELASRLKKASQWIVTTNEHNSGLSSFFKNILDWLSRYDKTLFTDKKVVVMSTSNGKRGGMSANDFLSDFLSRRGATVISKVIFPSYSENFNEETQEITNQDLKNEISTTIESFIKNDETNE